MTDAQRIYVRMCNVQQVLGVSPDTIRRYEAEGLPVHRRGQRMSSVRVSEYHKFIAQRGGECGGKPPNNGKS